MEPTKQMENAKHEEHSHSACLPDSFAFGFLKKQLLKLWFMS